MARANMFLGRPFKEDTQLPTDAMLRCRIEWGTRHRTAVLDLNSGDKVLCPIQRENSSLREVWRRKRFCWRISIYRRSMWNALTGHFFAIGGEGCLYALSQRL